MKNNLLLLLSICYLHSFAQAPDWQWSKKISGTFNEQSMNIVTDAKNNVYVLGIFNSSTIKLDSLVLTRKGSFDSFVAKYNTLGKVLWAKSLGVDAGSLAVNSNGELVIAGTFKDTTVFGHDTLINANNFSGSTGFIAKFDAFGNALWGKRMIGVNYVANGATAIAVTGSIYLTGMAEGKTFTFGNDTLIKNGGVSTNHLFIVKISPSGNRVWNKITDVVGIAVPSKIAVKNDAVYTTGSYQLDSVIFDKDTLLLAGESDAFLVKHDTLGNEKWAKSISGNKTDYFQTISLSSAGDVYFSESFNSDQIKVGATTVYNTMSQNYSLLIAKITGAGSVSWVKSIEPDGIGGIYVYDQTCDASDNLYVAGAFSAPYLAFAGDTLKNVADQNQVFIMKYNNSGTPSWLLGSDKPGDKVQQPSAINCDQKNDIYVTGIFSSSSLKFGQTTLVNGSINTYDIFLNKLSKCEPPHAAICMVTVDSISKNNVIIWDKSTYTNVDSFMVYRETGTNIYQPIAALPFASAGMFVDTVRTKYFPNTGNPNVGTYRYKIKALDTCGNYSELSLYHNTIFVSNNAGNFSWPQPYTIENGANPVGSYVLMRDDLSNNKWHAIGSVAGTQQTITDPDYKSWETTARWRIETLWNISCNTYPKSANPTEVHTVYNTSRSNILRSAILTEVDYPELAAQIRMFPNPGKGSFLIESSESISRIEITNMVGHKIYSKSDVTQAENVDISDQADGMYFIAIETQGRIVMKKFVLQH